MPTVLPLPGFPFLASFTAHFSQLTPRSAPVLAFLSRLLGPLRPPGIASRPSPRPHPRESGDPAATSVRVPPPHPEQPATHDTPPASCHLALWERAGACPSPPRTRSGTRESSAKTDEGTSSAARPLNHPSPTAPRTHQRTSPNHLKSFLEKTLNAHARPLFAPHPHCATAPIRIESPRRLHSPPMPHA